MAKKIIKRNKKSLHLFDLGGGLNTGDIGGGMNSLSTGIQNLQDAYNKGSQINKGNTSTPNFNASSNSDLLKQWASYNPNQSDLNNLKQSNLSEIGNTTKSTLSGAATGATIGSVIPGIGTAIGAGVGAAVGLGTGIAGWISGDNAAKKERDRLNKINQENIANFTNAGSNVNDMNNLNINANYSALGGKLYGEGGNLYEDIPNEDTHGGEFSNGVTLINAGGTHEQNPLTGVPMGIAKDGKPNLVEQGEVKYNDYIFSNRLSPDKKLIDIAKLPSGYSNKTFARIAEDMNKESSERPNDPISKNGLRDNMTKLQMVQEAFKMMQQSPESNKKAKGGRLNNVHYGDEGLDLNIPDFFTNSQNQQSNNRSMVSNPSRIPNDLISIQSKGANPLQTLGTERIGSQSIPEMPNQNFNALIPNQTKGIQLDSLNNAENTQSSPTLWDTIKSKASGMDASNLRYVPALGGAIGSFTDLIGKTNKPNYDAANMLGNFANSLPEVSAKPIGNYMQYTPLDRDYYLNKLNAQSAATRSNIINTSGGNRANAQANLLAADYNAQNSVGNLGRQAEEYNLNQRQLVENFNRGTNQFNSEQDMKAAGINRGNDQLRLKAKLDQASLMTEANNRSSVGKSANLTNLFESLGGIGKEQYSRNTILSNPALYYSIGQNGKISYKNGYEGLSNEAKKEVDNHIKSNENVKAKGGYLSKKNSLNINI